MSLHFLLEMRFDRTDEKRPFIEYLNSHHAEIGSTVGEKVGNCSIEFIPMNELNTTAVLQLKNSARHEE